MKKILPILLSLSVLFILLINYYHSNINAIPSEDISAVLSMLDDDTSGIAWLNQTNINLDSLDYGPNKGVEVDASNIIITKGGNYILTGTLPNGSIVVNTKDKVNLTLNNVSITNLSGPAIYIKDAAETYITLITDTQNFLTDSHGCSQSLDLLGTISSQSPLIFQGNGSLEIVSDLENGIAVSAPLSVHTGTIKITAGKTGICSQDNVNLLGGHLNLVVNNIGIDTAKQLTINDGGIDLTAAHTALYANMDFTMNGGTLNISQMTTGIKSASNIIINSGNINMNTVQAGLFADHNLTINNGNIHISSLKNAVGSGRHITINNGTVLAFATSPSEGLACADNELTINGGTLIALGNKQNLPNSKMSSQASVLLDGGLAHSLISIKENSTNILTFMPEQEYGTLLFSSPLLNSHHQYTLVSGGSVDKNESFYGLYSNTKSTGGELITNFRLNEKLTDLTFKSS